MYSSAKLGRVIKGPRDVFENISLSNCVQYGFYHAEVLIVTGQESRSMASRFVQ